MIGRTLLHYDVMAELGAGAMGRVYLALDTHTGRRVALKLLGPHSVDPAARRRLKREAVAAARLSHPGIVTLFALEETEGELFLVQELVDGETLAARLQHGPLGPTEVLRLAGELSAALAHAHAHGVVHRDLKPENILVTADGTYKIADFGIARIEGMSPTTVDGTLIATLPYVAPERLRGHRGDARADLFSLGAILYEAISSRRAFPGITEAEVCYAVMNEEPRPIGPTPVTIRPLVELVQRLLAKDPGLRPTSAQSVEGVIRQVDTRTPTRRARTGRGARWLATAAIAGVVLIGSIMLRPRGEPVRSAGDEGGLVVIPFENVSDPQDRERLGAIVTYLLVTTLARSSAASVVSNERVVDILHEMSRSRSATDRGYARAVARRARAGRIVTGGILRVAPTMVVTAEVSEVAHGRVLHAARVEGLPGQGPLEVVDALSREILRLAMVAPDSSPPARARAASVDLEASRYYVEGLEYLAHGELRKARHAFTSALERDPGFDRARDQLSYVDWLEAGRTARENP
jgi:TolB-like protein